MNTRETGLSEAFPRALDYQNGVNLYVAKAVNNFAFIINSAKDLSFCFQEVCACACHKHKRMQNWTLSDILEELEQYSQLSLLSWNICRQLDNIQCSYSAPPKLLWEIEGKNDSFSSRIVIVLWAAAELQGVLDHEDTEAMEDSEDDADSGVSSNAEDDVVYCGGKTCVLVHAVLSTTI